MTMPMVLVTGGSGFIAKYIIVELMRQGYRVRTTLRDFGREADTIRTLDGLGADTTQMEFVPAELLSDRGWDDAMEGCTYAIHVASPFPIHNPHVAEEIVRPAREGSLRVLKAAQKAGVKRVVLTSSVVAVTLPWPEAPLRHVFSEKDWTNPERPDITPYIISKTVAERAAWEYATNIAKPELTVVNPAFVLGPAPDIDLSTSLEVIRLIGKGAYPAAPKVAFPISDVRDVAMTHILAMTHPEAAGQRFISANGFMRLIEVCALVKEALPDLADKVPRRELPDFIVRAMALFDKRLLAVIPDLGFPRPITNEKAHRILGQTFRSPKEAVTSAAKSLRGLHLI